jgi:hypothetical protein
MAWLQGRKIRFLCIFNAQFPKLFGGPDIELRWGGKIFSGHSGLTPGHNSRLFLHIPTPMPHALHIWNAQELYFHYSRIKLGF